MARTFPKDRFDEVPPGIQRVGAHRAPHRRGRGWVGFAWAALATLVLVGLGALAIFSINGTLENGLLPFGRTPSQAPTTPLAPTITPTIDPALGVVVLNGTPTHGLAGDVSASLTELGWNVTAPANASQEDIERTVVFYSDAVDEGAALGLAEAVKGQAPEVAIQQTDNFVHTGAALTLVVGLDFGAASAAS